MSDKRKKYFNTIASVFIVLTCFLGSIFFWCFNESFYTSQHNKLTLYGKSISEHIGISDNDLMYLTRFTLDYLNNNEETLNLKMKIHGSNREVFTDDEKTHMVDVKNLYQTVLKVFYVSVIFTLFTFLSVVFKKTDIKELFVSYKKVLFGVLFIIAVLGSWILIDFDGFWTSFHHLFFMGNDLWLLDLRTDILIMIVPPQFFNNLVVRIVITFIITVMGSFGLLKYCAKEKLAHD